MKLNVLIYLVAIFTLANEVISTSSICLGNDNTVPLDFSKYNTSQYVNIFLYFDTSSQSTEFSMQFESNYISFSGSFGNLTLDGNSNFEYGEKNIKYNYNCEEMRISYKSFNKFWGSQQTDYELIVKCNRVFYYDDLLLNYLQPTVVLSFPVIYMEAEAYDSSNAFFSSLITALQSNLDLSNRNTNLSNYNQQNLSFSITNFTIEGNFLKQNSFNINNIFYFFKGNDIANDCQDQVTWLIFNDFLKINEENDGYLKNVFEKLNINNTAAVDYYFENNYSFNPNLQIYRNFYINDNYELFQNLILNSGSLVDLSTSHNSEAQFLKVLSKIAFIILIIILYE